MNVEVFTDGQGAPQEITAEMFLDKAQAQGRLHPGERGYWLKALREHPEVATGQLVRRRPSRALMAESRPRVSEDAYLDYARATGIVGLDGDPRTGPSWRR